MIIAQTVCHESWLLTHGDYLKELAKQQGLEMRRASSFAGTVQNLVSGQFPDIMKQQM